MRGLFYRIFLLVLIAVVAAFLVGILSASVVMPPPPPELLSERSKLLAAALERGDVPAACQVVEGLSSRLGVRACLLDPDGRRICGTEIADVALPPSSAPTPPNARVTFESGGTIREVRRISTKVGEFTLLAEHQGRRFLYRRAFFDLGQVLAVVVALGIVSFVLARYIAGPVLRLRAAVRRFAEGDLDQRIGLAFGRRRDELAELGRDFDGMAARIAALLLNQRRLLQDISHELRSPLTRQAVALELARRVAGPEAKDSLDRAVREAGRMDELIAELLTLTRLEAGVQVEREPFDEFDLEEVIRGVVEDVSFEARNINRIVRRGGPADVRLRGIPELLRRALENVLRNAVRYAPAGSEVELAVATERDGAGGESVLVQVRDHGTGVPDSELENIFRPFYRVSAGRERTTGGIGLGLAIADRAMRSHGGTIRARNAADGGLIVELRLPAGSQR